MHQKNTIVVSSELNAKIKRAAQKEGISKSKWVERELTARLQK